MIWTTTKPTQPGWYWWRLTKSPTEVVVCVNFCPQDAAQVFYDGKVEWLYEKNGEWSSTPVPTPKEAP